MAGTLAAVAACSSSVTSQSVKAPTRTVTATVTHQAAPAPSATATASPAHISAPPTSEHPVQPTVTATTTPPHAAPSSQGPSPSAATHVVIYGCDGQPVGQPAEFVLACGDGGVALQSLNWSGWGGSTATATGQLRENTCVPNCAVGGSTSNSATVTVSGLTGGRYTSMHISAPGARNPILDYGLRLNGPVIQ
ncbi:hypothetical protein DN069_13735 [Streptacidiphilus pinicola]|uniref:Uncharacterized protein n=1 Tax=Streptacidiphilus pinicola TaxID=2219663 RepID=A0A2X0KCR3_9ACTN|nr:hypothetical protein DN069_13735 [Streptacidiphilus pinicola]